MAVESDGVGLVPSHGAILQPPAPQQAVERQQRRPPWARGRPQGCRRCHPAAHHARARDARLAGQRAEVWRDGDRACRPGRYAIRRCRCNAATASRPERHAGLR